MDTAFDPSLLTYFHRLVNLGLTRTSTGTWALA
jgi:hypothetical protein